MPNKTTTDTRTDERPTHRFLRKGAASTEAANDLVADVDDFQAILNSIELLSDIVDGADAEYADQVEEAFEDVCASTQDPMELTGKLEFLAQLIDGLTEMEEGIKYRLQKLKRRRERIAVRIKRIREVITRLLLHNKLTHFQTLTATLRFRQSAPAVCIEAKELVPEEYLKIVTTSKVDNAALRKALVAGAEIPGVSLQAKSTLYIE